MAGGPGRMGAQAQVYKTLGMSVVQADRNGPDTRTALISCQCHHLASQQIETQVRCVGGLCAVGCPRDADEAKLRPPAGVGVVVCNPAPALGLQAWPCPVRCACGAVALPVPVSGSKLTGARPWTWSG